MAPIRNARVVYSAIPTGDIEPDVHVKYDDSRTIDLDTVELNGGFLLKTLCLSIDPYMRGRMDGKMIDPKIRTSISVFKLGETLYGFGLGKVIRSEDQTLKPGDVVHGWVFHEEYSIYNGSLNPVAGPFRKIENIGLPWTAYTGVLGMAGQTAYWGWKLYSKAKAGETVFVSTAAGVVGSFVVQLAKREGLRVIASSGSDDKVAYASELGADVSFNYKTEDVWDVLAREEQGIDVYFDNVGGEQLEAALANANLFSRFIECGMAYLFGGEPYNVKTLGMIVGRAVAMQGVLHYALYHQHIDEFFATVPQLVKDGVIKYREDISRGLETVGEALHDIGSGKNTGKRVVVVADD